MGLMDWLTGSSSDNKPAPAAPPESARGAEIGGLNFKSAVDAHMKWKVRLEAYINGTSDENLRAEVISCDDQCPLGKWIYSRGGNDFGYSETFFDMKAHHAHFHRCAGDVVRTAQNGDKEKALKLLHQGDYIRASERVKTLLAKLFVLVSDGKTAIDAHLKWKERLYAHVTGTGESLEEQAVARDDLCSLGHWLSTDGAKAFAGTPVFENLRSTHTRFHAAAGQVVATAAAGNREQALHMLEEGEYARLSDEITTALVDVFSAKG